MDFYNSEFRNYLKQTTVNFEAKEKRLQLIDEAIPKVADEVLRALVKHGLQDRPPVEYLAILSEETGEVAKAVVEYSFEVGWHLRADKLREIQDELIQVAATALSFYANIEERINDKQI